MNISQLESASKFASMNEVVMEKNVLVNKLIENKAKHDVVLATAIAGYWETAQTILDKRAQTLNDAVSEFQISCKKEFERISTRIADKKDLPNAFDIKPFSLNPMIGLVYPEDHSKDYEKAIAMMKSSVYEQVLLTAEEFDCYVLNNWEWKKNFLASNSHYIAAYNSKHQGFLKGSPGPSGPQGVQGSTGPVGEVGQIYNRGVQEFSSLESF